MDFYEVLKEFENLGFTILSYNEYERKFKKDPLKKSNISFITNISNKKYFVFNTQNKEIEFFIEVFLNEFKKQYKGNIFYLSEFKKKF